MPATNSGRDVVAALVIGEGAPFSNTSAFLGVGDSNTAFDVAQTDLQASTNKARKNMDSGYPSRVGNVVTFRAAFTETEAVYAWREWALFNDPSAGSMLNRKVPASSLGTKPNNEQWRLTVTLTFGI